MDAKREKTLRLIYQSCYRGVKELDVLLCPFARAELPEYDEKTLASYEDLLALDDTTLWQILSRQIPPPENLNALALNRLFAYLDARKA